MGRTKQIILCGIFLCVLTLFSLDQAFAQVNINLVAVNASDEAKVVPVKSYLPSELEPEDILDAGPLKLQYDVDKGAYYVFGEIQFNPKETKTFKIRVKDVWIITANEIDIIKTQLADNLTLLEGSDNFANAQLAKGKLDEQLDLILAQQTSYSENIGRRIEEYRAYVDELEEIRKKTFSLDALEREAVDLEEIDASKTLTFRIQVQNPSDKKEKTVQQKHYLPGEIRSEHVVDAAGFDIRYSDKRNKSYLSKETTFAPGEVKKYTIIIQDIWQMSMTKVGALEQRGLESYNEMVGSIYEDSANFLIQRIQSKLNKIRASQNLDLPIKEHIGMHRVNAKRYKDAEEDVEKLDQMLAIVRAKKLDQLEEGKVKNVLQKLKALRGLAQLSEALFKKGISVTQTWRIIMGTLIFISVFTAWHFITWQRRSKTMGEEQGPKDGEEMKVVPKPGEGNEEEEEEAEAAA